MTPHNRESKWHIEAVTRYNIFEHVPMNDVFSFRIDGRDAMVDFHAVIIASSRFRNFVYNSEYDIICYKLKYLESSLPAFLESLPVHLKTLFVKQQAPQTLLAMYNNKAFYTSIKIISNMVA